MATTNEIPLNISIAPFPSGFQGDMDETFQQAVILMDAYIVGNFLEGSVLPPGSTLPTSDEGPIAMGGVWYFWDPVSGQYQPQTVSVKPSTNYCKNSGYQIRQLGDTFNSLAAAATKTYDMALSRMTQAGVLSVSVDTGPPASPDTDNCPSAIKYTVGTTLLVTPAATDLMAHEHLVEGSDITVLQGEVMSLAFSVFINQTGTYSAYLTSSGRDESYVFSFQVTVANQWTRIKINNIPPLPGTGTWNFSEGHTGLYLGVVMAVGSQWQTTSPNQWVAGFFAGTSANGNLCGITNNQIKIAAIKLETAPACTYCAIRSFAAEYEDCIRYYWTSFDYQSVSSGVALRGSVPNNNVMSMGLVFPRRMCALPVVTPYSYLNKASGYVTDYSASLDIALANLSATKKGIDYLAANAGLVINGNTHTSTTIDGMTTVAGILVGMPVSGSGVQAGTTVVTVGTNSITISQATTSSLVATPLTFTLGALVLSGNTHGTTHVDNLPNTSQLNVGMAVSAGPDIAATGNTYSNTTVDTLPSTTGLAVGMLVTSPTYTYYGNTHSNTTIDGLASTAGILVGMIVSGQGLGAGNTVTAVTTTSVTLANPAGTTRTNIPITFSPGIPAGTTITVIVGPTSVTLSNATTATVVSLPLTFSFGIPPGDIIASIGPGPNQVTLALPVSTTLVNVALTFSALVKGDLLLAYLVADARLS